MFKPDTPHGPSDPARLSGLKVGTTDVPSANLDVLRAVAVIFVLVDHSLKFFGAAPEQYGTLDALGRLGVYFFFVHTSYVLLQSLDRQFRVYGRRRLGSGFYLRRLFRIYPLSIAVVALVSVFGIPQQKILAPRLMQLQVPDLRVFLDNVFLVQDVTGSNDVLGVLWSLPLELRMYIVLPPLFLFWSRVRSWLPFAALWLASVAWGLLELPFYRFSAAPYFACFLPGVIAFALGKEARARIPGGAWPAVLIALTWLYFILPRSDLTNWVICLLLGICIPFVAEMSTRPITAPAKIIAKYSYGVYLLHLLALWLVPGHLQNWPTVFQVALFLLTLGLFCFLAYAAIESPCVRIGSRIGDRWQAGSRRRVET